MRIDKKLLPSISMLAAFDATARAGSVSAAARELNLTHGAVSRQVAALEFQLGASLFVRSARGVRLTDVGRTYLSSDAARHGRASILASQRPDCSVGRTTRRPKVA